MSEGGPKPSLEADERVQSLGLLGWPGADSQAAPGYSDGRVQCTRTRVHTRFKVSWLY